MRKVAIISITRNGDKIVDSIKAFKNNEYLYYYSDASKKQKLKNIVKDIFCKVDVIVFISSLGICVRIIAPYIKSKITDPAIVCIPNDGSSVISVLGGHLGGANKLTKQLAKAINAQPIITTATDLMGIKAPDMIAKDNNLIIDSMDDCKKIASIIVDNGKVAILDEYNEIFEDGYEKNEKGIDYDGIIYITNKNEIKPRPSLKLIRKNIVLGIGCRKNQDPNDMQEKVFKALEHNNININAIYAVCSIDIKKNEEAIIKIADFLNASFKVYSAGEIAMVEHLFKGSDYVKSVVGVGAVAEPCVHLAGAEIMMHKENMDGMTLAIGEIRGKR